jgi:hypothetical protein
MLQFRNASANALHSTACMQCTSMPCRYVWKLCLCVEALCSLGLSFVGRLVPPSAITGEQSSAFDRESIITGAI